MNRIKSAFLSIGIATLILSCGAGGSSKDSDSKTENGNSASAANKKIFFEKDGLKVYALEGSPGLSEAGLSLLTPPRGVDLAAGTNKFIFEVNDFELGAATPFHPDLAASAQGQHIHFSLNNGPYSAYYESNFLKDLEEGHYVLLAFLARSYHESVKNGHAAILHQFVVGQPDNYKEADLNAPHLFYSRPKGNYPAGSYDKLLLDFYLVNVDLNTEGFQVRATINETVFTFDQWKPYVIEGLKAGEVKVKLELLDAAGKLVESPFNPVERTAILEGAS